MLGLFKKTRKRSTLKLHARPFPKNVPRQFCTETIVKLNMIAAENSRAPGHDEQQQKQRKVRVGGSGVGGMHL